MRQIDAAGIVLAGGRSSRMGSPKALLPFDGDPLIVHIVNTLRLLFDEIVIVAAPGQDLPDLPATVVHDDVAYQGPVGGICYGLRAATRERAFVTSCDSAFLNPRLISHLLSLAPSHDVVVPFWDGRLQPLHAVYSRRVVPLLEAQLARNELRPVSLFDRVRTRRIDEDEIRLFDPDGASFFNMNTPDDYRAAAERWAARREQHPASIRLTPDPTGVPCTVELFGVARLLTGTHEVPLAVAAPATCSRVFAALAEKLPVLVGRVIAPDRARLVEGYACNVNGAEFVRTPEAAINPGDRVLILSADAGG
jgi:molybdenum cofactor guanylyltransferase